ncbi:MAG: hypothetical protein RL757_752 [Bacteroidota bacterium]|jgi:hypothetical protein
MLKFKYLEKNILKHLDFVFGLLYICLPKL